MISNLDDLRLFLAYADAQNARGAAERLGISQPTLTERMRHFESELPSPLFKVVGRKKVLTPLGLDMHRILKDKLTGMESSIRDLFLLQNESRLKEIRIAGRLELLWALAGTFVFGGETHLNPCSSAESIEKLKRGAADIAITRVLDRHSDFMRMHLLQSFPALFVSRDLISQNSQMETLKFQTVIQTLLDVPLHCYEINDQILEVVTEKIYKPYQRKPQYGVLCDNWLIILKLVEQGLGYAVMPTEAAGQNFVTISPGVMWDKEKNLVKLQIDGAEEFKINIYAMYRKSLSKNSMGKKLLQQIKTGAEKIRINLV